MKGLLGVLGMAMVLGISFVHIAAAQDPAVATNAALESEEATAGEDDNLMYTYGTVVSVSADSLVINEYDFDSDSFKEITYSLTAEVKFSNVKDATEIVAGDSVEVYYVLRGDQKIAKTIGRDEEDILEEQEPMESSPEASSMTEEAGESTPPPVDTALPEDVVK